MKQLTDKEKYDLKRKLEELKACKGQHTELISLYIPPTRQISDVMAYLRNEYSESSNIKSKTTRKNVLSAIESIMSRLRYFKTPPPNGLAVFVGHKNIGSDQTEMVAYLIEPPLPITTFLYRCDSSFYLEPLEEMLAEDEIYGLFLIDRRECTIGVLRGKRVEILSHLTSRVPGKHGRGGQSQRRFERLTEIAAHEWFVECGEKISNIFLKEKNLKGIFVGGPGPTKQYFVDSNYLHHEIQKKIIAVLDTGYTDESGIRELVSAASEVMSNLKIAKEKNIVKRFLQEVTNKNKSRAVYGEEEVRKALNMGAVDTLLLSEDLRNYRISFKCPACGYTMEKTVEESKLEKFEPPNCPKCENPTQMVMEEKKDLIDELSELAEETGAKVELISRDSDEGDALYRAFGGIAGILRYNIE
ncbi:MAG: peptide chain release factor aRF-1 [Thermoplasmata archaeon]|nr:peptide chain release factor aRF-1 [Thermoplasmata archaeon]